MSPGGEGGPVGGGGCWGKGPTGREGGGGRDPPVGGGDPPVGGGYTLLTIVSNKLTFKFA